MSDSLDRARVAAHNAAPWLATLARVGYVAKGVLYLALAALVLRLAQGTPEGRPDPRGAVSWLDQGPWGQALMAVLAIGLLGYAAWKLAAAVADRRPDVKPRLGAAVAGIAHLGLGLTAASRLLQRPIPGGGGGGGNQAADWSARLMAVPGGQLLVGAVGAGFVAFGLWQLARAWRGDAAKGVDLAGFDPGQARAVERMGAAGFAARGVAFGAIGAFLGQAAVQHQPGRARGFGEAITGLLAVPAGQALVALVGLAFGAYGLFMFVKARSPRLDPLAAGD